MKVCNFTILFMVFLFAYINADWLKAKGGKVIYYNSCSCGDIGPGDHNSFTGVSYYDPKWYGKKRRKREAWMNSVSEEFKRIKVDSIELDEFDTDNLKLNFNIKVNMSGLNSPHEEKIEIDMSKRRKHTDVYNDMYDYSNGFDDYAG